MDGSVKYAVADGVATITFNRPVVMNALDADSIRCFCRAAERAAADDSARVVVLCGAGPAFVAGGDVAMFARKLPELATLVPELANALNRGILALRRAPKPVIASVHGAVAGAGFSIMLACDLVLAAVDTQFSLAYARIGACPDGGATWFLPRLTGYQRAMELMLLADAVDAVALEAVVDVLQRRHGAAKAGRRRHRPSRRDERREHRDHRPRVDLHRAEVLLRIERFVVRLHRFQSLIPLLCGSRRGPMRRRVTRETRCTAELRGWGE
jgi:enoyl-CoA hydratase/carnithine racemase